MNNPFETIIIGAGASGMMAAISALRAGKRVCMVEGNNEVGKKLSITGGGRCNILNVNPDTRALLSHYDKAEKYLHSLFSKFGVADSVNFFKELEAKIEIKVEDRYRAFPISEKATDVRDALQNEILKSENVTVLMSTKVIRVNTDLIPNPSPKEKGSPSKGGATRAASGEVKIKSISTLDINTKKEQEIFGEEFILATGGLSKPETGSTGDGFKFLKDLNINLIESSPTLTPIFAKEEYIKKLSGKTLKNLKVDILVDGKKVKTLSNKISKSKKEEDILKQKEKDINVLCTHFGLSGPSIINNSKHIKEYLEWGEVTLSIDLFKEMNEKELDQFILNIFEQNKNKKLKNVSKLIHESDILSEVVKYDKKVFREYILETEVNDIRKEERREMISLLKGLKVTVTGLAGYDKAIIADGGVDLKEVDWNDMSLKKIKNLKVTGDLLNIYRPSGGYSLLLCWVSGYVAGK